MWVCIRDEIRTVTSSTIMHSIVHAMLCRIHRMKSLLVLPHLSLVLEV